MADWSALEAEVADHLGALADGGFVVLEAPGAPARDGIVRPRRLGGLLPERRGPQRPYAQAIRIGSALRAELAGPPSLGGAFPWSDEEEQSILTRGWSLPADDPVFVTPNYVRTWPDHAGDARSAAAHLVASLRDLCGCPDPAGVAVRAHPNG